MNKIVIFSSFFINLEEWNADDFRGAFSGQMQFMKNTFYFTLKALFVLKIFKYLSWLSVCVVKRFDWKDKVNFKIYDVTAWLTNNCAQYLEE